MTDVDTDDAARATDDGADLAEAFMANELMKQTRDYIERGRDYQQYDDYCLEHIWVGSFIQWHRHRSRENAIANDDAAAELRLRGIPEPHHRVRPMLDAMRCETERMERTMGAPPPGLVRRMKSFLAELATIASGRKH